MACCSLETSDKADFLMRYYNSDGSYGGMCGNGGRCISRYAYVKKIVNRSDIRFEALEHRIQCLYFARRSEIENERSFGFSDWAR